MTRIYKLLCVVLSLTLAGSPVLLPAGLAGAQGDGAYGFDYYVKEDDTVAITGYHGAETTVVVPDSIDGRQVTEIAESAFIDSLAITGITLPKGLIKIGMFAFMGCENLADIHLPERVTDIEQYAFYNCKKLTSITLPEGMQWVDGGVFSGCNSLATVKLPASITSIWESAFSDCYSLTSIRLPSGVEIIADNAFYMCKNLQEINLPESITHIGTDVFAGCDRLKPSGVEVAPDSYAEQYRRDNIFDKLADDVYQYNILYDGTLGISGYAGTETELVVPASLEGMRVTQIADGAFMDNKNIVSVSLPEGITGIGKEAFRLCTNLESIQLPDSLQEIGVSAFSVCLSLKNINLPNGLKSIGSYAFSLCEGLTRVNIPLSVNSIGADIFFNCKNLYLSNIRVSEGSYAEQHLINRYFHPEDYVFHYKSEGKLTLSEYKGPGGDLYIPARIGDSVITEINYYAFDQCTKVRSIALPNGVVRIKHHAFDGCTKLEHIGIGYGLEDIEDNAFLECTSLREVRLPNSMLRIGNGAFSGCTSLKKIYLPGSLAMIGVNVFWGCDQLVVSAPAGSYAAEYAQRNSILWFPY